MRIKRFAVLGVVVLATIAIAAQTSKVTMNGKLVSTSVRQVNGVAYVKLADVAKAFDMTVVKKGSNYELVKAGGATMLKGTTGKLGEEIFTGQWKFLAKDLQRMTSYTIRHNANFPRNYQIEAGTGEELVVINCRFKNGVPQTASIYFNGMGNTSLTDMSENGYPVKFYDSRGGVAENILPGAGKEFAVVFAVPKGTELKDFIYTIEPVSGEYKKVDLRISLR